MQIKVTRENVYTLHLDNLRTSCDGDIWGHAAEYEKEHGRPAYRKPGPELWCCVPKLKAPPLFPMNRLEGRKPERGEPCHQDPESGFWGVCGPKASCGRGYWTGKCGGSHVCCKPEKHIGYYRKGQYHGRCNGGQGVCGSEESERCVKNGWFPQGGSSYGSAPLNVYCSPLHNRRRQCCKLPGDETVPISSGESCMGGRGVCSYCKDSEAVDPNMDHSTVCSKDGGGSQAKCCKSGYMLNASYNDAMAARRKIKEHWETYTGSKAQWNRGLDESFKREEERMRRVMAEGQHKLNLSSRPTVDQPCTTTGGKPGKCIKHNTLNGALHENYRTRDRWNCGEERIRDEESTCRSRGGDTAVIYCCEHSKMSENDMTDFSTAVRSFMRATKVKEGIRPLSINEKGEAIWHYDDADEAKAIDHLNKRENKRDLDNYKGRAQAIRERQEEMVSNAKERKDNHAVISLDNFFYGHRTYMGVAPEFLKDRHVIDILTELSRGGVKPYSMWDLNELYRAAPEKQMSILESDPVLSAWVTLYRLEHDRFSTALYNPEIWSQQPFELDLYVPGSDFERQVAAAVTPENKLRVIERMVQDELRIGHAGTLQMALEHGFFGIREDCNVHSSDEIQEMLPFGSWLSIFGASLEALKDMRDGKTRNPLRHIASRSRSLAPSTSLQVYEEITNSALRVVLDFKCQTTEDIMPLIVQAVNRQFGVIVSGVGSFYRMPANVEDVVQISRIESTSVRLDRYQFFFGVEDLEAAINESGGRVQDGD